MQWTKYHIELARDNGADLSRADLSGADLSGAYLSGADLSGADLSGADLSGADLSRADLSGADLSRADLSGADLSGADLYVADLSGADLSGAYLSALSIVLLAQWGSVSDTLCLALMRHDASGHHNPKLFTVWANGGACPYADAKYQRLVNFQESRELWKAGRAKSIYSLVLALFSEKGILHTLPKIGGK